MTNSAFLKSYRDTLQELRVMEHQLEMCGITGRPSGASSCHWDSLHRSTNDATAAAIQLQDGIEAAIGDLRQRLAVMERRFDGLVKLSRNYRDRCILRQYYQLSQTDAQIAESLSISTRHANRLRAELLALLDNKSNMSTPVVACPHAS